MDIDSLLVILIIILVICLFYKIYNSGEHFMTVSEIVHKYKSLDPVLTNDEWDDEDLENEFQQIKNVNGCVFYEEC
ncbi:MAG: hypothetical protein Edafosvirus7_28 [Edafosvirus sp.]|uniref:Uncharacterized protein n=1 Tax=Edafosvirus sp. TaxID=2487765 RepID=A0A3G4ZTK7_9VIRU|nr:MAG: hypothetical protein Edafosvirus7_28 [Edafosvirus sp.]